MSGFAVFDLLYHQAGITEILEAYDNVSCLLFVIRGPLVNEF